MRTLIKFTLILCLLWKPCFGAWSEVARNVNHTSYFLDLGKIQNVKPYTYAWLLVNFLEPSQSGDMSEVHYVKVHCDDFVFRTLKVLRYGGPMGLGNVTENFIPSNSLEWMHAKKETAREAVMKNICFNNIVE